MIDQECAWCTEKAIVKIVYVSYDEENSVAHACGEHMHQSMYYAEQDMTVPRCRECGMFESECACDWA